MLLREMKLLPINEENLDEYVRFNRLRNSVDKERARAFLQNAMGQTLTPLEAKLKTNQSLRDFILNDHFDFDTRVGRE